METTLWVSDSDVCPMCNPELSRQKKPTCTWVSDSDVCPMCNGLLDWFSECPHCGYDGIDWEDEEEIDYEGYALDFDEQGRYIGG